MKWEGESIGS